MKKLREYQIEAINSSAYKRRGIVCMPTGTGKTTIQSHTLIKYVRENPGHGVYLILAPRIVLSYQLLKDYYKDINDEGIQCWYAGVHSGRDEDIKEMERLRMEDSFYQKIETSTSSEVIKLEIHKAKKRKIPIVIFGTYHSAERASKSMGSKEFDLVICDESHYLVTEQFQELVKINGIKSKSILFYTATMHFTRSSEGRGMNNTERFGEVLYSKTPREMIDQGYMVRPRMHIIKFDREINKETLNGNAGKIIWEAFRQHQYFSNSNGKIFVTCTGTPMMEAILKSQEIKNLKRTGVKVYAIASDESIGNQINGIRYNRQDFLRIIKEDGLNISQRMIILHIDILTEGIDIPGITGILPFRSLKKSKFIQTLGRASRICREDLEAFSEDEYSHKELGMMVKPYSWVMVPDIEGEDMLEDVSDIVYELRQYGFNPWEDIFISNENGKIPPTILLDPLSSPDRRNQFIFEVIERIRHEVEGEEISNLLEGKEIEELLEIVL